MRYIILAAILVGLCGGLVSGEEETESVEEKPGISIEGDLAIVESNSDKKRLIVDRIRDGRLSGEKIIIYYPEVEDAGAWDRLNIDILRDPNIRMDLTIIDKVIGSAIVGNVVVAKSIHSSGRKVQVWRNSTDMWCLAAVVVFNLVVVGMAVWLVINYKKMFGEGGYPSG